jgi:hypothetical protein
MCTLRTDVTDVDDVAMREAGTHEQCVKGISSDRTGSLNIVENFLSENSREQL